MNGTEDKRRFAVVIYWLGKRMACQGGKPKIVDADLISDYYDALCSIGIERIEWAAKEIFARRIWFPMPAEIREFSAQAPATALPAMDHNQRALPEASYYEDGSRMLKDIIDSLSESTTG